jgi:hypothetical protein
MVCMTIRAVCLFATLLVAAVVRGEIVLSVTPQENAPPPKEGITVPKPRDAAAAKPAPGLGDALQFSNNDVLHGLLLGIDAQTGVRWQNPDAKQPIDFKTANLSQIKLDGRAQPAEAQSHFSVRLTNGDELIGDVASMDAEKVEIDTWYAGRLTLPRKVVRTITPLASNALAIYEGPASIEGWKLGEDRGAWRYKDGALIASSSGPIGRDFKLPDAANIEFDVAWRPYLQLMVSLYTDSIESYSGNCYMLQINSSYAYLQRMRPNGGSNNLGQIQIESLQRKSKARISIRVNKESKTISLLVDGELMKQWNDRGDFAGRGGGVVFYSQGQGVMKVTNIRITPWDGKFEDRAAKSDKSKEDTVRMENNDKVSGKLEAIKDGNLTFSSSFAKLEIPLKRVQEIEIASESSSVAKRNAGDVRAYLVGRGSVTFALEKWDDKGVTGRSANFGQVTFSPRAFQRVQFNLDQQPAKSEDDELGDEPTSGPQRRGMIVE